jgi:hypothetical protein
VFIANYNNQFLSKTSDCVVQEEMLASQLFSKGLLSELMIMERKQAYREQQKR